MLTVNLARVTTETRLPDHVLPDGRNIWTIWPLDPIILIPLALIAVFYAAGLGHWPDRSREHPWWRTALFYTGLAITALSVASPLHALAERHFSMHMVQHMLIIMAGVPLTLLGAPTTPVLRGMPRWLRHGLVRPLSGDPAVRAAFRGLLHPMTALVLFSVVLWGWHLAPGWYDAATADETLHAVQHFSFTLTSTLFWWNVISPAPLHASMSYLLRMVYLVVQGTVQSILAAFITMNPEPLYDYYVRVDKVFPISVLNDQQLGGLIMWIAPGSLINLAAIGVLFAIWFAESERRQQAIETADGCLDCGRSRAEG